MTDSHPHHPTTEPDSIDKPEPRNTRNIPKLVWIILALVIAAAVIAFIQYRGTHVTPMGGTAPQAEAGGEVSPPPR